MAADRGSRRGGRGEEMEPGVSPAPLEGLRVLDLGWTWAGPYAGMILCDLGADVIKVETSTRIDMLRFSGAFSEGERHPERSAWHGSTNRGKRSLTIDLKQPEGRQLVLELAGICDAAIENFAPRVLPDLGLGYEDLSAANPRLVLLSLSAHGATGPDAEYIAYGDHLTYASGLASVIGHPDDSPTPINTFYGDPVAGMFGALALLAAVEEAELTGAGRHLEYSQVEGLLSMIPGCFARRGAGQVVERSADKSPSSAPHGFYRCAGDDAWVAIAVEDDAGWSEVRTLMRAAEIDVTDLDTLDERKSQEAALDAAVTAWTSRLSPWEVTRACQDVGVAAYPMIDSARLVRDLHLHEREFFQWVDHPVMGPSPIPGVVFRVGDDGARVRGPAPLMGEHNEDVLIGLLGLDRREVDRLEREGVVR